MELPEYEPIIRNWKDCLLCVLTVGGYAIYRNNQVMKKYDKQFLEYRDYMEKWYKKHNIEYITTIS